MMAAELLVILAMVAVNSLLAGYEIALASVSTARLQALAHENRLGAAAALSMKQNMVSSLAALQVGITLVAAVAAATGGAGAEDVIAPLLKQAFGLSKGTAHVLAIAVVVLPLTVVMITLGELVPKVFALRNKERVCLRLSPAMRWFTYSVWPAVWLLETPVMALMRWGERRWQDRDKTGKKIEAAELQELRALAALARASRLIGEKEEGIIVSAARLSSRPVREIMLPAEHISMLNINESFTGSLIAAHLDMHTRFPVAERVGDAQSIVGYVNFKDILAEMRLSAPHQPSLRGILRPIPSLTDQVPIASCLETLIHEHAHIALVRDAAGKVAGMITLEDILEELVGDIQDEYDRLPAHVAPSGWAWVAGGGITLARLKESTGVDLAADPPAAGARNLNDWVAGHLAQPVHGGEVIQRGSVRVVVRKVRRQKVLEAQVGDAVRAEAPAAPSGPPIRS